MYAHSRGAKRVRVVQVSDPRKKRAQERPGADRTHGPRATKSTRQNHRLRPNIRPSLRGGFSGVYVISPGTGFLAPVLATLLRIIASATMRKSIARGISTGMPEPHDLAVLPVLFVRPRNRVLQPRQATASRTQRP